jgi:hypothetical protein
MDITDVIMEQHQEQRRGFAQLDDVDRGDTRTLTALWSRLAVLLEAHARAEELFFYPRLLEVGTGAADADDGSVTGETKDAISDHNEIRDAVRTAARETPGSDRWWDAVIEARIANGDHMAQEERQDLPDFRRHADLTARHEIAVQFLAWEAEHAAGVATHNQDPDSWVHEHS